MSKLIESIILLSEFTPLSQDSICSIHQRNSKLTKACIARNSNGEYMNYIDCNKCAFVDDNLNLTTQTLKENIQNV